VRLPRDLDEALDVYSRVTKVPVSKIIEDLVRVWASENEEIIGRGRELFGMAGDAPSPTRRRRK
jgi:hypothetical protein